MNTQEKVSLYIIAIGIGFLVPTIGNAITSPKEQQFKDNYVLMGVGAFFVTAGTLIALKK